ncbi:MAG: hypothetical protein ABIQ52_02415 [Vicinamibacterales bacterium]
MDIETASVQALYEFCHLPFRPARVKGRQEDGNRNMGRGLHICHLSKAGATRPKLIKREK